MTGNLLDDLGVHPDRITNPYGVPEEFDRVLPVRPDVVAYSETIALSTWNPQEGVGIFVHAGRCPQDLELWWAQVAAYLPDGLVAADRSWGRCPEGTGIRTGNLDLRMDGSEPGWAATFDGAAEVVPWTRMLTRPTGAGCAEPISWELRTAPNGPVWDMYAAMGHGGKQDWASGMHTQQVLTVQGSLTIGGRRHLLDGVGWKDHSGGSRSMAAFGRDHFLGGSLPGRALHCLSVFGVDGTPLMEAGNAMGDDQALVAARLVDVPPLGDLDSIESEFEAALVDENGRRSPIRVQVLNSFPMAISDDNDNINGVEWEGPDVLVLIESRVKLTTDAGAIGFAHLERGARRSFLRLDASGRDGA